MVLFLIGLAILVAGYFTYGKLVEKIFGPDDRPTPAVRMADGVDYVALPHWKNMLIQLLNIAGIGPVIGVIIGTTAIIVMLSIGLGLSYGFQEQLESFGNLHTIQVYSWGSSGNQDNKLDDRTLAKMEKIDGATSATYSVTVTAANNGYQYRCEARNADGASFSRAATLKLK